MATFLLRAALSVVGLMIVLAVAALGYRAWRQHEISAALAPTPPGGIAETRFVTIGGIEQWISIRGEDRRNPVLLVLHGGPAMSYMAFAPMFRAWEKHFTVVQWDRRGVGKTYGRNSGQGSASMTLERIADDGAELSQFLRTHLHKDKIILMGHSMGSMIGLMMAKRHPDLFYAYVGTDQIVDMARNEALSYELLLAAFRKNGDQASVDALAKIGPPPFKDAMAWGAKENLVGGADEAYRKVGRSEIWPALLFTPDYSLGDMIDFVQGNRFCIDRLYSQWMAFKAADLGSDFAVPMIILQGESDVMAPTVLTTQYFDAIHAPKKELLLLKGTGHLAMFTNPQVFLDDLVAHVRPLAVDEQLESRRPLG